MTQTTDQSRHSTPETEQGRPAVAARADVVYCVHREALASVFHSQVLVPLSLHTAEVDVKLAGLIPLGHLYRRHWRAKLDEVAARGRELGVDISWLPSPPSRAKWLMNETSQLTRWVKRRYRDRPVVLHCRNPSMANIALQTRRRLPGVRVVFDCRGMEAAELAHQQGIDITIASAQDLRRHPEIGECQELEKTVSQQANHITCVSDVMRTYLIAQHNLPEDKLSVVPCCLQTGPFDAALGQRDEIRKELGLDGRLVVVYCGSLVWYQYPEQSLRMVRLLRERDPRTHFLAITTQPDDMRREVAKAGISEAATTIISVTPREVPKFLVAGDLALLLRDNSLVNRVASPVKFAEYMAAGLPVVISENLGDYSAAVGSQDLGTVVALERSDVVIEAQLSQLAESPEFISRQLSDRCREFAAKRLSWPDHLQHVSQVYRQLISSVPSQS